MNDERRNLEVGSETEDARHQVVERITYVTFPLLAPGPPHLPSFLGHPLPSRLLAGEGGLQPAPSPAGAGRVRGEEYAAEFMKPRT
jgi:hypothetical protein